MNPNDAGRHGVGNPDSSAAGKKGFSSPYIALYPSSGLLGWPNGSQMPVNQEGNRNVSYGSLPQFNPPQAGIPVLQSFPQGFVGFGNHQAAAPDRRKTNRTPVACVVCHKAKSTCDRSRPCARCRRLGKSHLCKDRPHRKKGRPRKRLLNSDGSTTDKNAKAPEKKTRSSDPTSSSDAQKQDFKLSDCYLGNEIPQFISKKQSGRGKVDRTGDPPGQKSAKGPQADAPLTELQNSFAQMSHATNNTLWEEIIGDMSSFIDDTKKQEHKYKDLLSKMPNIKRIMQPSFCMYLTHMSYYLHPDQFIQLQKRMASSGTQ